MKTIEDKINFIYSIEERFEVDNWKINDLRIWPIIRINLGFYLFYKYGQKTATFKKTHKYLKYLKLIGNSITVFFNYVGAVFFSISRSLINEEKDSNYFFLTLSYDSILIKDKYYNKLIDPIIDQINCDNTGVKVFEYRTAGLFKYPTFRSSNYLFWHPLFFKIRSLIFKTKILSCQLKGFDAFIQYLNDSKIPIENFTLERLVNYLTFVELNATYFVKVFKTHNVKIAFTTEYYSLLSLSMIVAANRSRIPSIDIQHGLQNEYHFSYAKWCKLPNEGYELLPKYFFVWSNKEYNLINSWNGKQHEPIITGNLFLNKFKNFESDFVNVYNVQAESIRNSDKLNILLTLQDKIPPIWLIEFINNSSDRIEWWIRSHPVWTNVLTELLRKIDLKVKTFLPDPLLISSLPLYSILKVIDINVIQTSTTIIESSLFNKPTLIIDKEGLLHYKSYIENNIAYSALNKSDFEMHINKLSIQGGIREKSVDHVHVLDIKLLLKDIENRVFKNSEARSKK